MKELLRISGKRMELPEKFPDWKFQKRPGGWIVAEGPDGERYRFMLTEKKGRLSFSFGGKLWSGEVLEDRKHGLDGGGTGDADLVAQFPGKVRKILVKEGSAVQEGEPLILVEAMKMEFSIKAPFNGKVTRLLVGEGQQISPGQKFLDLEETSGG